MPQHVLTPDSLHNAIKSKETIGTLTYLTSTTKMGSFFGICNVYRYNVSKDVRKAPSLSKLLERGQPARLCLDEEGIAAVDELQNNVVNPQILALPRGDAPFPIEAHACKNWLVGFSCSPNRTKGVFDHLDVGYGCWRTQKRNTTPLRNMPCRCLDSVNSPPVHRVQSICRPC